MYDKKELATIMGALIDKAISTKQMIEDKEYVCEEELQTLKHRADTLDKLANKTSELING